MHASEKPIACTLDGRSFTDRAGEIRGLFARALRGSQRDGPRLHLAFDAAARADVEEIVRKERACCAFLDFDVSERDGLVRLTITVPPAACQSADEILASFEPRIAPSCDCAAKPTVNRLALAFGLGGAGIAVICAAACVAVAVLVGLGVGSAALNAFLPGTATWAAATGAASLLIAAAWIVHVRSGGSPRQLKTLQIATAVTAVGAIWGLAEAALAFG